MVCYVEWLNHMMVCYVELGVFAIIKNDEILHHFQKQMTRKKLPKLPSTCGMYVAFRLQMHCQ